MAPFNSYLYLNNDSNDLPEDQMDSASDIFPTIEETSFCSNFQCCGRSLKDLHELLHHYEDSHVRIEDVEEDSPTSGSFDFDTVIAADSLLTVGAEASNRSVRASLLTSSVNGDNIQLPTPSSSVAPLDGNKKRPKILTLGIETCDYANDDSDHLSAFDNTVIRPVDPSRAYNLFNGHNGFSRIAPKRSQSVPALPNFPLINGESGFKLIHSILSSTADPPSSENYGGFQRASNSPVPYSSSGSSSQSGSTSFQGYSSSKSGNDRPFICPVSGCGKTYKNANGLKYHAIHGHDGVLVEKPHKCPFAGCGKRYKNSNGLKYHFQHAHPNTPPPSGLSLSSPSTSYVSGSSVSYRPMPHGYGYPTGPVQQVPPRPQSVTQMPPVPQFNRPAPPPPSSLSQTLASPESVQSLLASAPGAIVNLLKKNPNLKQHLPAIIRNLQQMAAQKSSATSDQQSLSSHEKQFENNQN